MLASLTQLRGSWGSTPSATLDEKRTTVGHLWSSPALPGVAFRTAWRATARQLSGNSLLSTISGLCKAAGITRRKLAALTPCAAAKRPEFVRSDPAMGRCRRPHAPHQPAARQEARHGRFPKEDRIGALHGGGGGSRCRSKPLERGHLGKNARQWAPQGPNRLEMDTPRWMGFGGARSGPRSTRVVHSPLMRLAALNRNRHGGRSAHQRCRRGGPQGGHSWRPGLRGRTDQQSGQ